MQPHGPLPGSFVHGDTPGKNTVVGAMPPPGALPKPGIEPKSAALQVDSSPAEPQGKPPKILEWVAYSFSGDLPNPGIEPGSPALHADSLPTELSGKPKSLRV